MGHQEDAGEAKRFAPPLQIDVQDAYKFGIWMFYICTEGGRDILSNETSLMSN
jgi:hypothetical protein